MSKPIKRNANIVLLSRDHHDGLLISWKVRQGLAFGRPLPLMAEFITFQFAAHLEPHFVDEERLLFAALDAGDDLRKQAEAEHASLRQMVAALATDSDQSLLEKFITTLDDHIRFEERVLFPHIEQQLDDEALTAIGKELAKTHDPKKPDTWTNSFWLKDK